MTADVQAAPVAPAPLSRLVMPALMLALAGISVVVFARLCGLTPEVRDEFLAHNTLGVTVRTGFLVSLLAGAVLPLAAIGAALLARRARAVPAVERVADLCAPLMLICFLPVLFSVGFSHANQLMYLLVLGAFGMLCQPL
ncbi:MAG TPA: hypothetical protein VGP07_19575, partial [Polyangia bacterium]